MRLLAVPEAEEALHERTDPMSWLAMIVDWFARRDPLARAGELAVAEAERMFVLDVVDPPAGDRRPLAALWLAIINDIIHRAGWTWIRYRGNERGAAQWCGHFAAACWRTAGIDPKWLATFWASTLRLAAWARYRKWNETSAGVKPATAARMLIGVGAGERAFPDGSLPRAGDIVIVGDGTPIEGDHITLLISYDPVAGAWHTISGNGGGVGPDGKRREGIVKTDYKATGPGYRVLWVLRPGEGDLLAKSPPA